ARRRASPEPNRSAVLSTHPHLCPPPCPRTPTCSPGSLGQTVVSKLNGHGEKRIWVIRLGCNLAGENRSCRRRAPRRRRPDRWYASVGAADRFDITPLILGFGILWFEKSSQTKLPDDLTKRFREHLSLHSPPLHLERPKDPGQFGGSIQLIG